MKMWKRITSLVLVLCMMLPMFCFSAGATTLTSSIEIGGGESTLSGSSSGNLARSHSWGIVPSGENGETTTGALTLTPVTVSLFGETVVTSEAKIEATAETGQAGTVVIKHTWKSGRNTTNTEYFVITVTRPAPTLTVTASIDGEKVTLNDSYVAQTTTEFVVAETQPTAQLAASAAYGDVTYTAGNWRSNNEDVVTVDNTGKVTCVDFGEATVSVDLTATGRDTITVMFPFSVTRELSVAATVGGSNQTLSKSGSTYTVKDTVALEVNGTTAIQATADVVAPDDVDVNTTAYQMISSDSGVATVAENGEGSWTVTAVGEGRATITATIDVSTLGVGTDSVTVEFPITVTNPNKLHVYATVADSENEITAGSDGAYTVSAAATVGNRTQLSARAVAGSKTYSVTSWQSLNTATATVSSTGAVTGVAKGKVAVVATLTNTADSSDTITVTFNVTVTEPSGTTAYFYLLRPEYAAPPDSSLSGEEKAKYWAGFGVGKVNNPTTTTDTDTINSKITQFPQPTYPTYNGDTPGTLGSYPTFTVNGVTYTYSAEDIEGQNTYYVEWFQMKTESGANCPPLSYVWVKSTTTTWHIDGRAVFRNAVNGKFMVKQPGASVFTDLGSDYYFTATKGDLASSTEVAAKITAATNACPDKSGYVFMGWYADEACTIPITDDTVLNRTDMIFYGKYVNKTVTFKYLNASGTTETRVYNWGNDSVPLPKGPNGGSSAYFAGWYNPNVGFHTLTSVIGDYSTSVEDGGTGNSIKMNMPSESVTWTADSTGGTNMTLYAIYYTTSVENYDSSYSSVTKSMVSQPGYVDTTELFGTPAVVNGNTVRASFNVLEDNLKDYTSAGFVFSQVNALNADKQGATAVSPTAQGGYQTAITTKVLRENSADGHPHYIQFTITLADSVGSEKTFNVTPFAILNGVYIYGTSSQCTFN